eukprot:362478-Chlamydomonas_euryale.AAC.2
MEPSTVLGGEVRCTPQGHAHPSDVDLWDTGRLCRGWTAEQESLRYEAADMSQLHCGATVWPIAVRPASLRTV